MAVTDTPVSTSPRPKPWAKLAGFIFPLFFVICFPLTYVSATHSPAPNDLSLTIVGSADVVSDIAQSLDDKDEFVITQTDVTARAQQDVEERVSVGALLIAPADTADASESAGLSVTAYTANGGGPAAAGAVQAVGQQVAEQLSAQFETEDVAPLAEGDRLGSALFFLLTYSSIGAYLMVVILTMLFPKGHLGIRFGAVAAASVAIPLFTFGLSAIFVGDYGQNFETITRVLAVDALYVFTVGSLAILLQSLMGRASMIVLMGLVVFMNLPSSGGTVPAPLLPPFWQGVHSFWFGSGALESFRSLVYFDGNGIGHWLFQLAAWAVIAVLLTFIVELSKTNRALRTQMTRENRYEARRESPAPEAERAAMSDTMPSPLEVAAQRAPSCR
ncbi:ABC transporter permease [Paramicrobacterium chengjingii]|uniref:ABC transporter permease n=1 Tax=Paramicrobacterium chengjingii TaxID=2769067 RepID=UPI00141E0982|nr:ABC transporter permease [Microbacterium chengjingii]